MDDFIVWARQQRDRWMKDARLLENGIKTTIQVRLGRPIDTSAESLSDIRARLNELDALLSKRPDQAGGEPTWSRRQTAATRVSEGNDELRSESAVPNGQGPFFIENELRRVARELKARHGASHYSLGQKMLAITLEEMVAEMSKIPAAFVRAMEPSAVAEFRRQRLDELYGWLRSAVTRADLDRVFARLKERLTQ